MTRSTMLPLDQPIDALTVGDLQVLIAEIVRKVVREEISQDYYVNEKGIRVVFKEEDITAEYLTQLNRDYKDIESGKIELVSGETVLEELRELGLDV